VNAGECFETASSKFLKVHCINKQTDVHVLRNKGVTKGLNGVQVCPMAKTPS